MVDPVSQLENLRERIADSDISEADRGALDSFDRQLGLYSSKYSDHRRLKLLRHCTIMAEKAGGLAAALEDKEAAEDVVEWINSKYDNEETNRDYRIALRVCGRRVNPTEDGDTPPSLDWVPSSTSRNYDTSPDPREMLHWEEHIVPMIEGSRNSRDAAMIALQFDAGLRGGEFKTLTVGSVQDHRHGLQVTVDGKQGRRTVTLIPSSPYVSRWLENHPGSEDETLPMWTKLNTAEGISDRLIYNAFGDAADRAGVSRPITLTNFRKSSAAFLASRNLNQAHIEDHHGWVRGSKVASRYISVFGDASERELARVHGKDVSEEEPASIAPVECYRCGESNPHNADFCGSCRQALDREAKRLIDELAGVFDEATVDADDADDRRDYIEGRRTIEDNPGAFSKEELHQLLSSMD